LPIAYTFPSGPYLTFLDLTICHFHNNCHFFNNFNIGHDFPMEFAGRER